MSGIFISYRRSDSPDATGRIYDRLVSEFGKVRVFKDVDSIPLGQDFRGHLNGIVGECGVVLAIIGPQWLDVRNPAAQRRLDDPDDFVRIELEAALARDIPVVPVPVGHAPIPGASELPASLAAMAFRQSIEVRPDPDFHNDATRLVAALRRILNPAAAAEQDAAAITAPAAATPTRSPRRLGWIVAAVLLGIVAGALSATAIRYLRETPPPEMRTDINAPATDVGNTRRKNRCCGPRAVIHSSTRVPLKPTFSALVAAAVVGPCECRGEIARQIETCTGAGERL